MCMRRGEDFFFFSVVGISKSGNLLLLNCLDFCRHKIWCHSVAVLVLVCLLVPSFFLFLNIGFQLMQILEFFVEDGIFVFTWKKQGCALGFLLGKVTAIDYHGEALWNLQEFRTQHSLRNVTPLDMVSFSALAKYRAGGHKGFAFFLEA